MPSAVIASIDYDPQTQTLRVVYVSGNIYNYHSVPPEVYQQMRSAYSKGIFLNKNIKGKFPYEKI